MTDQPPLPSDPPDPDVGEAPAPGTGPEGVDPERIRQAFLWVTLAFYGVGFAISLVAAWLAGHPLRYLPGTPAERATWIAAGTWLSIGLGVGLVVVLAGMLASRIFPALSELEREFATHLFWMRGLRDPFILAALSSIGEEAFFRGLLQPWLGLFWTSVLFGACHPPLNARLTFWPLFALGMSLLMGWLFDRTGGNLLAPTMVHFTVNFLNLRLIARSSPDAAAPPIA